MDTPAFEGLVPMLPVSDVPATIAFYQTIGFKVQGSHPFFSPRGEFHVHDVDGYAVFISHAD